MNWKPHGKLAMTKLGITVAISAAVFCLTAEAQTISVMVLDQTGAQSVLQAAAESAQQRKKTTLEGELNGLIEKAEF